MDFLSHLKDIATHPLAFVGYIAVVALWFYRYKKISDPKSKVRRIINGIKADKQKVEAIKNIMGTYPPPGLSDKAIIQWTETRLKKDSRSVLLTAYLATLLTVIVITGLAFHQKQVEATQKKGEIQFLGKITDEQNNPVQGAYAYIVFNKDTFWCQPSQTGQDGNFLIKTGIRETVYAGIYYGIDTITAVEQRAIYPLQERITLKLQLKPSIQEDGKSFSLSGITGNPDIINSIKAGTGLNYSDKGHYQIRFGYDKSKEEQVADGSFRYNYHGRVTIYLNNISCGEITAAEIPPTPNNTYLSRAELDAYLSAEATKIVTDHISTVIAFLNKCIKHA